jgi:hypothetical protein
MPRKLNSTLKSLNIGIIASKILLKAQYEI